MALLMFSSKVKISAAVDASARERAEFSWYWVAALARHGAARRDERGAAMVDRATNPLPVIIVVSDGGEMTSGSAA